jgi:hypothetical protein
MVRVVDTEEVSPTESSVKYRVGLNKIKEIAGRTHFANDGDGYEKLFWSLFNDKFPNPETFWRYLLVPLTKRIIPGVKDPKERLRFREGVSEDLKDIATFQYCMFLNLIYSHDHLRNFRLSSFEDFYLHLGSACDLAEDCLLKLYMVSLECKGGKSKVLEKLTKEEFLNLAETWYKEHYSEVYENYLMKGKPPPIRLPKRQDVLREYFADSEEVKEYSRHTQKLREYRNILTHYVQIAKIVIKEDITLVPKKEKIQSYKKWSEVFKAQEDVARLKRDFIEMKEQMVSDIWTLEIILNKLWLKPIKDLRKFFYEDKNEVLLSKYNIELT